MRRVVLLLVLALLAPLAAPAIAQDMSGLNKQQRADTVRFARNNSLFVLYHEVAHLLVHQLQLPVLGKEEDAADNLATWVLLNKRTSDTDQVLADAAQGWMLSGVAYDSGGVESDYAAAHSLDKQRAYQIVCLMVGSDQNAFRPIANQYALDRDRQDTCDLDYSLIDRSLRGLLKPGSSKSGDGAQVTVTYHDAGGKLKLAADAFRSSGIFDQVAEEIRQSYNIPRPVRFNARRCGEANAFYYADTVEIIFCYELMQDYMQLYVDELPEPAAPVTRPTGAGKEKSGEI